MPDQRSHRGPHPDDVRLFSDAWIPSLRHAVHDLNWLLSRGYSQTSSLKLVGDRYALEARQRTAVARCACSDQDRSRRSAHQLRPASLAGQALWIDGYNVLTTIEAALSGGVLIQGTDGCLRDMASMHGSYHRVEETVPAIHALGDVLIQWRVSECRWYFDQSVSNSGRLKRMFLEMARDAAWNWTVELVPDPDPILSAAAVCVATADSQILNAAFRWIPLVNAVLTPDRAKFWMLDLSAAPPSALDRLPRQSDLENPA